MATLAAPIVSAARAVSFAASNDVNQYFSQTTSRHFLDWFNTNCEGRDAWVQKTVGASDAVKARFSQIWNQIPVLFGAPSINLVQFSALMSILVNEVGAQLLPISELSGRPGHPGLAYTFDMIPSVKRSYNAGPLNKTAGELFFNDDAFWEAHQLLPMADDVRRRPEFRSLWNGQSYPQTTFSSSLDHNVTGFIQEADFYKFRGRGFIQATWRENYKRIVSFVQTYNGNDPTVLKYTSAWAGLDDDSVASQSTNADWDDLFQNSNLIVASAAVGIHNKSSGNYLLLASDPNTLGATTDSPGSFFRMGLRISGGTAYATLFRSRVIQLLTTLNPD